MPDDIELPRGEINLSSGSGKEVFRGVKRILFPIGVAQASAK